MPAIANAIYPSLFVLLIMSFRAFCRVDGASWKGRSLSSGNTKIDYVLGNWRLNGISRFGRPVHNYGERGHW